MTDKPTVYLSCVNEIVDNRSFTEVVEGSQTDDVLSWWFWMEKNTQCRSHRVENTSFQSSSQWIPIASNFYLSGRIELCWSESILSDLP